MPRDFTKNPNFALLFNARNRNKETDPEYDGHGEILCSKCGNVGRFWLKGWRKTSAKAGQFLSLVFKDKGDRPQPQDRIPWD